MSNPRPARPGYQTPVRGSSQQGASQAQPQGSRQGERQGDTRYREGETQYRQGETQYRQTEPRRTEPPRREYREPERPKRPWWHAALLGLLFLAALGGIIAALASTTHHHVTTPKVPHVRTPAAPAIPGVGSSFVTRDAVGNSYRVRLDRIVDPATGVGSSAASGSRLVGAVYTVTGVSGSPVGENVVTNASLLGNNGHIYRATGGRIAGFGNFNNSNINVTQGTSQTGAATYQIPSGVKVSQAQWAAAAGHGTIDRWSVK